MLGALINSSRLSRLPLCILLASPETRTASASRQHHLAASFVLPASTRAHQAKHAARAASHHPCDATSPRKRNTATSSLPRHRFQSSIGFTNMGFTGGFVRSLPPPPANPLHHAPSPHHAPSLCPPQHNSLYLVPRLRIRGFLLIIYHRSAASPLPRPSSTSPPSSTSATASSSPSTCAPPPTRSSKSTTPTASTHRHRCVCGAPA